MAPAPTPSRPFAVAAFRRLWLLAVVANLATMIQTVAAAWLMTGIGSSLQVALIQSAIAMPMMLFAVIAGTLADTTDRTRLMLIAYCGMLVATGLAGLATMFGWMTPAALLTLCFLFGLGSALFGPTGLTAVNGSLPRELVPEGVASIGIGFNLSRCVGPAVGGMLVAVAGSGPTFAVDAAVCLVMVLLLVASIRAGAREETGGPGFRRALVEGFVFGSERGTMRIIILRTGAFAAATSSIWALTPLISRDLLHGDSITYGILVSALGIGAIAFGLSLRPLRRRFSFEQMIRAQSIAAALCLVALPFAPSWPLAALLLMPVGAAWTGVLTMWNVSAQLFAPEAMVGRAVGTFQTWMYGGLTGGSWLWGHVAQDHGLAAALIGSGIAIGASAAVGWRWPTPTLTGPDAALPPVIEP